MSDREKWSDINPNLSNLRIKKNLYEIKLVSLHGKRVRFIVFRRGHLSRSFQAIKTEEMVPPSNPFAINWYLKNCSRPWPFAIWWTAWRRTRIATTTNLHKSTKIVINILHARKPDHCWKIWNKKIVYDEILNHYLFLRKNPNDYETFTEAEWKNV